MNNINRFCELADIPYEILQDHYGNTYKRFVIHSMKKEKTWLEFILSSLKISTDADLLAQYYKTFPGYSNIFFDMRNWLYDLDKIAQIQLETKSSLNIVITGLGSLTGCGKSWSSIALCLRWSPTDEKGRILFTPEHVLMEESEIRNIEGFHKYFYSLDDPELNSVGVGINAIKQRLDKFMRIASRYGQTSLNICSAIDILKSNRLSLDGIHFYLEMLGVNKKYEVAVGMLYDRFYNPKGWVLIPSPLQEEITFYDLEQDQKIKRKIICFDSKTNREWKVNELMNHYEQVMKKEYVERIMKNENKSDLKDYIDEIIKDEKFKQFIVHPINQSKMMIEAWLHTDSEVKLGTKDQYKIIASRLFSMIKEELPVTINSNDFVQDYFVFKKELVMPINQEYFKIMFSDQAKDSLKKISTAINFQTLIEQSWKFLKAIYVDKLFLRDIANEENISIATISVLHREAREAFIGYLDEYAYAKLNPTYEWQGGNTASLADFIDYEKRLVISKKFRYDKNWKPTTSDLSHQEQELLKKGWSGLLLLTDGLSRKSITFSITPPTTEIKNTTPSSPASKVLSNANVSTAAASLPGSSQRPPKSSQPATKQSKARKEKEPPKTTEKGGL